MNSQSVGIPVLQGREDVNDPMSEAVPADEPGPDFVLFTVIAYRWGWTNAHQYQVAVEVDLERAIARAEEACNGRGGKYGVAVYGWTTPLSGLDASGEVEFQDHRLLHYAASTYREDRPFENPRQEMFTKLGHVAHSVATTGQMSLHSDVIVEGMGEPAFNARGEVIGVVVPETAWLRHAVRDAERDERFMGKLRDRINERQRAGVKPQLRKPGEPLSEEDAQWFEQAEAEITLRLAGLFRSADSFLAERRAEAKKKQGVPPCPFCAMPVDMENVDTIHPNGSGWKMRGQFRSYVSMREVPPEQWCYTMHCVTTAGGCGAEIAGDSREEALERWSSRSTAWPSAYRLEEAPSDEQKGDES